MKKYVINGCDCYLTEETANKIFADIEEAGRLGEYERQLDEFFHSHIANHTEIEYQAGMAMADALWEVRLTVYDDEDKVLSFLADRFHGVFSKEKALTAIQLVRDCDFYSDWHKDVYGFRPRYTLK